MRLRPVATVLAAVLLVAVGTDYVSYAATGKPLILGRANTASQLTVLQRTTPGPAAAFRVRSGPPFTVNSRDRVGGLNSDRLDGLDAAQLAPQVTAFQPSACNGFGPVTTTPAQLAEVGDFTVARGTRLTSIDLSTTAEAVLGSSSAVVYELRVDGRRTTLGRASVLLRESDVTFPVTLTGVFRGLAPGSHALSIWVYAANAPATYASADPGCWNTYGVNNVYVTQTR